MGSDHFSIHVEIKTQPAIFAVRAPNWVFNEANWVTWNTKVEADITTNGFCTTNNPEEKYQLFRSALLDNTSQSGIYITKPVNKLRAEPAKP